MIEPVEYIHFWNLFSSYGFQRGVFGAVENLRSSGLLLSDIIMTIIREGK